MTRTLIIGATGKVGRQVVSQLLPRGVQIRALTRNPRAANLPSEVEVRFADLTAPETLDVALRDIDAVFLVWTAPPVAVSPALQRIAAHTKRMVFLSAPHKTPHPLFQQNNPLATMHAQIERHIEESGVRWTFLRPGMFAANARTWWASQIREGEIVRWPYLSVPTAPIHERDIAAVAIRALCEEGHAGREYLLTGPQSLTHAEQVAVISRVIGRPLRAEELSPQEARSELLAILPAPAIEMLLNAWGAAAGHAALVTSTVAEVTGTPACPFEHWVQENTAAFRA